MSKRKRTTLPPDFEALLKAGDMAALKAVFDTCDVDARGGYNKLTALAFNHCPDELAHWLVAQGADISAPDAYGDTPLHARAGHWQGRLQTLIDLGADVNHSGGGGTPLHRAAAAYSAANCRLLLRYGAQADALNRAGLTPLAHALQRCGNAHIVGMAEVAEVLLPGAVAATVQPASWLRRLLGKAPGAVETGSPDLKAQVVRIGTDFEFHRRGFNGDLVAETSAALDRLYALFEVAPVVPRVMHDGRAPIRATARTWEERHQRLWQLLVPSSGPADTVQGEVIRITGRISDEIDGNGGTNWDADYRKMARALLAHLRSRVSLPNPALAEAEACVAGLKGAQSDPQRLCALAVDWVALNPEPVQLPKPDYRR